MNRLRYKKEEIELFAQNIISNYYNSIYSSFKHYKEEDEFDFVAQDGATVLEVTLILSHNDKSVLEYEAALSKNKTPRRNIVDAKYFDNGELECYYGGSIEEIAAIITDSINKKNKIALKRRREQVKSYELCLAINEGGLFNSPRDFNFLVKYIKNRDFIFNKYFLITCSNFYVIDDDIREYERKTGVNHVE